MLSDVSSLTEPSSEDESFVPVSKGKKGRPKKEWQPKQVLKAPRLTQYSTTTLYEEILNGKVDLDPEYQRDVVWTDAKQSGLIDSILRNFYIPPVIFAFSQNEDGEERRTCIDGKQRLTSIQRFMDGQIPFKDSRTNLKLWYKIQPGNDRAKLLPAQYRKQFDLKQISCVEYTDINDDAEREIFQRVQLGVALTPAERMQAIAGPWPQQVRDILSDLDDYKISDSLEWSKTRGRDFHSVATILYLIEKSTASYPSVTVLEKWLQRVTPPTKAFQTRAKHVFAVFRQLVLTRKFSTVFQKPTRVSPIEFVMIVVLIDTHYKDHTLTQLADGIRRMRRDVRATHDDIRANTKVTKTLLGFINNRWPDDLKKAPSEKKALDECKANPVPKPAEVGKRKRGNSPGFGDSDSSDDDRPLKSKAKETAKTANAAGPPKSTSQTATPASHIPASTLPAKPEWTVNVKTENATTFITRPSAKTDRLAEIRRAKERAGILAQSQTPTPPPTTSGSTSNARQTPVPQTSAASQNASVKEQASNIINNPNSAMPPPSMWPNQFNPQIGISSMSYPQGPNSAMASQFQPQMFQPNMPVPGQGPMPHMMHPPSNPNAMPSSGVGIADPRSNPYRSGPPTPNFHSASGGGWPSPNDPNQSTSHNQRSMSVPSAQSRFDRPGQSNSGGYHDGGSGSSSRHDSPRQSPLEPRGRGQGSPGMRGRPWYSGTSDRDRDVLGNHAGGINGRDLDKDRNSSSNNWSNRNGR